MALLAACGVDAPGVENVSLENPGAAIKIDLSLCKDQYISAYLPLGSLWISVRPLSHYACELELGGETENPNYSGGASQYCVFYRLGSVSIDVRSGGPAYLDNSACTDL